MKRQKPVIPREDSLRRLVSSSKVLDSNLKRYWLGVLDHLTPASKERLKAILAADSQQNGPAS